MINNINDINDIDCVNDINNINGINDINDMILSIEVVSDHTSNKLINIDLDLSRRYQKSTVR